MKPRRTPYSNIVFSLDGGTEDNDMWACKTFDSEHPDRMVVTSVWEPTAEERSAIAAGANIELACWGWQPPVALQTTTEQLGR